MSCGESVERSLDWNSSGFQEDNALGFAVEDARCEGCCRVEDAVKHLIRNLILGYRSEESILHPLWKDADFIVQLTELSAYYGGADGTDNRSCPVESVTCVALWAAGSTVK